MQYLVPFLTVLLELFKVFWLIYGYYKGLSDADKAVFTLKLKTWTESLKIIINAQKDAFDEDSYKHGLELDVLNRFTIYKSLILNILNKGLGITEMSEVTDTYMGDRVKANNPQVIEILGLACSNNEKSCLIAKLLAEYVL